MANPEHLEVLWKAIEKRDINIWNHWRRKNQDVVPDLSGANLRAANLRAANLRGTDLRGTDLRGTDLIGTTLIDATLIDAKLIDANLRGVKLRGTDLTNADLTNADLTNADLTNADLTNADLQEVNFTNSACGSTVFVCIDLSKVIGLETVHHYGPSSIGIDTLYKSGGNIPREFLEGCGVPETMITFVKSLVNNPIEFYSCFISYSSKDEEFCKRLVERMKSAGLRVWFAPEEMKGGRKIYDQIDDAIRLYDKLIVVLSEHSMNSAWVRRELINARKREKAEGRQMLFPVSLVNFEALQAWQLIVSDGEDLAEEIRLYYIPDFSNWKDHDSFSREFDRLVADLRQGE